MEATTTARTWRPWAIWLPCGLAFLWSGFLIIGEIVVVLLSNLTDSGPPPPEGWVYPAVIGHCVLAGTSVVALVTGLRQPSRRRAAAITAWMIIPIGYGWFVLASHLLRGA